MSARIRDLLNNVTQSSSVSGAKDYIKSNAQIAATKVAKVTTPYKEAAVTTVQTTQSFVKGAAKEVRSAQSITDLMTVLFGIMMSMFSYVIQTLMRVRDYVLGLYQAKYLNARNKVGDIVDNVKIRAIELPNTPVGKKVESVSKRFLGDSRHDQAVEFIKCEVFPRMYKSYERVLSKSPSPSGSTEVGSVSPTSRQQQQPKKMNAPKRK